MPKSLLSWLSVLSGALSIVALIRNALVAGFGPTLSLLIAQYEKYLGLVLDRATPMLEQIFVALLTPFFPVHVEIGPVWKHVTVLTGLYFLRNVTRLYEAKKVGAATYQLVFAFLLMFLSGGAAGVLQSRADGFWSNLGIDQCSAPSR